MQISRDHYPKQLIIDIHSYCNATCKICPYPALKKIIPMGIMDEDLFKKIVQNFLNLSKKNNFKGSILFCNMGELFVYPELAIDRLKYVLQYDFDLSIQTNGALLTPKMTDSLNDIGYKGPVTISFHGISPDVYKRVMGLNISKTLKNIDYLIQNYPKEKIGIQSIPCRWPRGEAKHIRTFFNQKGIGVRMPLPNNRAGLLPEISVYNKESLIGCNPNRPLGEMVVCFDGDVVLCCNDMAREEIVGNLKNSSIEEVWNGDAMISKVNQIYCGQPSNDNFICKKCEFGVTSASLLTRLLRNTSYEIRKFILTHVW
ncbi:MAG: radical SAM/SPASM domain-containing protein [Smithella sp.]